jgi:hypothetical protein
MAQEGACWAALSLLRIAAFSNWRGGRQRPVCRVVPVGCAALAILCDTVHYGGAGSPSEGLVGPASCAGAVPID